MDTFTATDLMTMHLEPPPEIVKGVVSVGYNILAGAPKAGKSWVSLGLALAVASGGKAFGVYPCAQCDVLYLALEDHAYRLKDRLRKITHHCAVPRGLRFATAMPKLSNGGLEELHAFLHVHTETKLVIIDTLGRVSDEKKGDIYQEDYSLGSALQSVALAANAAVMVVHHTNKSAQGGIRQVSGSFGVSAAADVVMVLNRHGEEPTAKLMVTGRDVDDKTIDLEWYPMHGGWVSRHRKIEPAPWVRGEK